MSKFVVNNYMSNKEILRVTDHYVGLPVAVSDEGIVAEDGKKIVKAGTIIGGKSNPVLENTNELVVVKNTQGGATGTAGAAVDAEGVLLYDVDVTHGPAAGSMVVHGFIKLSKIPEAPVVDAKTALKQIIFVA